MTREIRLDRIRPSMKQPRKHFAKLEELAESLRTEGQQTPVLVRPVGDGFEIVQGERRWRAAKIAGLETIRADVRELSDEDAFRVSVVENLQRANLTPIEEAQAFQTMLESGQTQADVGKIVGKSQSYVAQKLRLLRSPEPLRALVAKGAISEGHHRELLRFESLLPEGLENKTILWENVEDSEEMMLSAYNATRPEDNPPVPLWLAIGPAKKAYTDCEHKAALRESFTALIEYVTRHNGKVPQWIVSAWWYGSAAVVFELAVSLLSDLIDGWFDRFQSALAHAPVGGAATTKDEKTLTFGYRSDLRHSSISNPDDYLDAGIAAMERVIRDGSTAYPSALQSWGFQHEVGKRLQASDLGD